MGKHQTTTERVVSTPSRIEPVGRLAECVSLSTLTAVLWATVLAASATDVVTTTIGLQRGLAEGNALARTLVESFGIGGLAGLKLAALGVLAGTWYVVDERQGQAALAGFGGVTVIVVGCNVATIATM
ncbi:hypothetical protein HLRTI_002268 [Halorhabdus tiamatea SARL4B]|uniref:DUF5658 domain-containing protein n=1 Tax=Halorhabdus tiamatea SARL4B TaxID=1033806 RepID=F7PFB1_9EURY|nr:DUF5658 family protein [Halorhabdus tiamatea]ERJ05741.1 hypothetical protein HLRTI_002268 [Halorhabdus tiamatea SARL4B]CCQ33935.1 conserved hypothetical protein [Halorhabdus tiamatea SARL4B]